jgi:serine/threonine protein kinase
MSEPKSCQKRGRWTLAEAIGGGGNADVWRATSGTDEAALKILRRSNPQSEPYRRFVREIEMLAELAGDAGVLPMLDYQIPDGDRPSFSMPIAQTAERHLENDSVEAIVGCLRDIALTLARLLMERDVTHRDVKPSNLYRHEQRWVVGDLGLVDRPSLVTITAAQRFVGPAYFVAFDIMQSPEGGDYRAGDVFALAKTLWVLLVGQRWPCPGEHRADRGADSVYLLRPHRHAQELDEVLALATRRQPHDRLRMDQFAAELDAWLNLDTTSPAKLIDDISDIQARLRRRMAAAVSGAEREEGWRKAAANDEAYLLAALPAFYDLLRGIRPDLPGFVPDDQVRQLLTRAGQDLLWESISTTRLDGPRADSPQLRMGRSIHLFLGGAVRFNGAFILGGDNGSPLQQWSTLSDPAPAGSLLAKQQADNIAAILEGELRRWLELFEAAL